MEAIRKPLWVKILNFLKTNSHFVLLIFGITFASYEFSLFDYIKQEFFSPQSRFFEANYTNPKDIHFIANKPKSLVLIYIESLENTYSNPNIFKRDLLHSLNAYKTKGVSFARYTPMPGTEWTIAGLVATQCSVPLKSVSVFGNNRQGEILNNFLPKAKCLGDILADNGYKNVFMNGPSLHFAGVGEFFKDHHYSELYGKEEWLAKGYKTSDMSGWGLHDDDLFAEAKLELGKLVQEKQPFNLTLLTIDTHGFDGYFSKTCLNNGYRNFPALVECTSNQVANFIDYIRQKGWLNNIDVVVLGDHLAMKNKVYDQLESESSRTIFNLIVANQPLRKNTDDVVGFDMLPTILDTLGIHTKDGRVGLGYSAVMDAHSLIRPANRLQEMKEQVGNYSKAYNQLW